MDIIILDSWLREFLNTKATPKKIAECFSLCGPSVEKIEKWEGDYRYHIEVTTNRVDMMSVYGIAREASAILPRFGYKATLKPMITSKPKLRKNLPLKFKSNPKLENRLTGIIISDVKNWKSPPWLIKRLESAGHRSLNAIVDITNYVMAELGHPMHAFDYDKIKKATIIVDESKKGEKITSLENKTYTLPVGSIIFRDIDKNIIDLPGIIGTKNSVVSEYTKRVLFFIDNNDPVKIRKTSMTLGIRTVAATLNEKSVDPNLALPAILRALDLANTICKAKPASQIHDLYPNKLKTKNINISKNFLDNKLGLTLPKSVIKKYLQPLGFKSSWSGNTLKIKVPTFRSLDINISEDILEEVARIHGYHNIESKLMSGNLPEPIPNSTFTFESKIKNILKSLGATEIYTQSLVSKKDVSKNALKLINPMGKQSEYLRTSLKPSLSKIAESNSDTEKFHLFEISNIYLPQKNNLPDEKLILAGIFKNHNYRQAKGIIESLLSQLNINSLNINLISNNNYYYYEFQIKNLYNNYNPVKTINPLPKYPPQIEDLSLTFPKKTKIGEVINSIKNIKYISNITLKNIYKNTFTFTIHFQHPNKTLTDNEVKKIRTKLLEKISKLFGAQLKS